MKDLLLDVVRFLWYRTSERATCVAIMLGSWLCERDCRQLGDYFKSLADNKAAPPVSASNACARECVAYFWPKNKVDEPTRATAIREVEGIIQRFGGTP